MPLGRGVLGRGVLGRSFTPGVTPPLTFKPYWATESNNFTGGFLMSFKKNTAVTGFTFGLVSSTDGSDITTGTPVVYFTLDGGTQTAIADVTPTHEGNGQWSVDLLAAEMNGDIVGLVFTHTSALTRQATIKTTSGELDATALSNLQLMYDGTGYTDSTAPASREQVDSISSVGGGGAISYAAIEDNTGGAIVDGVTFVGSVVSGTFASLEAQDGVYHEMNDSGNVIDIVYGYNVGGGKSATGLSVVCNVSGNSDVMILKAYDHIGATWDSVAEISGSGGAAFRTYEPALLEKHTGTGAEIGKVYIRFDTDSTSPSNIQIDKTLVQATVLGQSVGYASGRVWIDTLIGTAGTESFVNGVADNKSLTFADALTIGGNIGINEYEFAPNSTLTPSADLNNANVYGIGYALNLGGFDYAGTHFYHAAPVNGVATAQNVAGRHFDVLDSIINNVTIDDAHFTNCSFGGTITLSATSTGEFKAVNCRSILAGATPPVLDFNTGVGINHDVTFAAYQNGLEIRNYNNQGVDQLRISGMGQLIIASTCSGSINISGDWDVTDNSVGAVTFNYDDNTANNILILEDTSTTLPATLDGMKGVGWDSSDSLEAIHNNTLSLASSNADILADTNELQLNQGNWLTVTGFATEAKQDVIDTNVDAILVDTGTDIPLQISNLNNLSVSEVFTTQLTESYAADGVAPTLEQAIFLNMQNLGDVSINATTVTVKKLDGTTVAATYTLDDDTNPTSRTRTS